MEHHDESQNMLMKTLQHGQKEEGRRTRTGKENF
jgi:hypothetical protein